MQVLRRSAGTPAAVILGLTLCTAALEGGGAAGSQCQVLQESEDGSGLMQLPASGARPPLHPAAARKVGAELPRPLPDSHRGLMREPAGILDNAGAEGTLSLLGTALEDVSKKGLLHEPAGTLDNASAEGTLSLLGAALEDVSKKSAGISDNAAARGVIRLLSSALEDVNRRAGLGLSRLLESEGSLGTAAAREFTSLINLTLEDASKKAGAFLANCTAYRDGVIKNISACADTETDGGLQALQSSVKDHMVFIEKGWSAIVKSLSEWKGPTVLGLKTLGLRKEADSIEETYDAAEARAANVFDTLKDLAGIIATLGDSGREDEDRASTRVDTLWVKGLGETAALNEHLVEGAKQVFKSLRGFLDTSKTEVKQSLDFLEKELNDLARNIKAGLESAFTGTYEATKLVLKAYNMSKPEQSAAIGSRAKPERSAAIGSRALTGMSIIVTSLLVGQL